ncbi:SpoIIE family protein phosphatase [Streptomyces sp. NPDC058459]|uniref:SpoIIE family protein phosphatase n=1 Tax=Streptomyces sp. NPDC058459 TaxID=3346508 RepID=UPI00365C380E
MPDQVPRRKQTLDLQPGARLVLLSEGVLERNAKALDLPELIVDTGTLHPTEAARALIGAVVEAGEGHLKDDATVICFDRHGTSTSRRDADTGATLADASAPVLHRR